ncbi:MAG: sugar translocase [Alphaproteobacteria bacterium]|nr:sugar translocase [Alphaproteobacteria bacterium]
MNLTPNKSHQDFSGPLNFFTVLRSEWRWCLFGAIVSFVLASVLVTGFPRGLVPNLAYPYIYGGDGLSHLWMIRCIMEGWIFENSRNGFPFGSGFLDYPGSDFGNLLVLKLIGFFSGETQSVFNLFFLLSFPVTFITSFCVLKSIGLIRWYALAAAALFTFLPFHFQRIPHLFYTWYFVVPLFFYAAFFIAYKTNNETVYGGNWKKNLFKFIFFISLALFGVYYAFFGAIVFAVAGLAGWGRSGDISCIKQSAIAVAIVSFGVLINVAPSIVYKCMNGSNPEVARRSSAEAEIHGLKLIQMVIPRADHRIKLFSKITQKYQVGRPLVHENATATLGIVGASGFCFLGLVLLLKLSGRSVDSRLVFLSMIVYVLFLFGTIGGLGAIFSFFISPLMRGWNRISVFIGFGSIAAFFFILQDRIERFGSRSKSTGAFLVSAGIVLLLGLFDQTVTNSMPGDSTKSAYKLDKDFIEQIERSVPKGSAIYQLPYIPFPEAPILHRLDEYCLTAGFIHSKSLNWSYGGIRGRKGDLFYKALSQKPTAEQINTIRKMGFSGIYIDRRGFADNADALINELTALLKAEPTLKRADGEVAFFRLEPILYASAENTPSMRNGFHS